MQRLPPFTMVVALLWAMLCAASLAAELSMLTTAADAALISCAGVTGKDPLQVDVAAAGKIGGACEDDQGEGSSANDDGVEIVAQLLAEEAPGVDTDDPGEQPSSVRGLPVLGVVAWMLLPRQSVATWAF
mmetsp:Transcript_95590/g.276092  ORF Transcript_95590/g.276092 Transcript_95590/m.276092 type:complete len:130 (+) Transcript_95590:64-453(+)